MKIEIDTETITPAESDFLIALMRKLRGESTLGEEEIPDVANTSEAPETEINEYVHKMHKEALGLKPHQSFKASELYRNALGGRWVDLSPNTRKSIGRQFKKVVNEHWKRQQVGEPVVVFKERNIQNTAIYQVVPKSLPNN